MTPMATASAAKSVGHITASMGVAHWPQHGSEIADVLQAADSALYEAKRSGRNRVVVAA